MNQSNYEFKELINAAIATDFVNKSIGKTPITIDFIKSINGLLLDGLNQGGIYRTTSKIISGISYDPPDPNVLPALMEKYFNDLAQIINEAALNESEINYIDAACFAHCELAKIQPFEDGNKRTARLIMNKILAEDGINTINYKLLDIDYYIQSTLHYYSYNDIVPFTNMIYEVIEKDLGIENSQSLNPVPGYEYKKIQEEQQLFASQMENDYDIGF